MDTPDLAELVPDLMARHPHCAWSIVSGRVQGEALVVELHPFAWPDRVAQIEVNVGGEVFFLSFAEYHDGPEYGYEDSDKREVLEDRLKEAVDLATGPTRIIRDMVDGVVVLSRLVRDPDGPEPRPVSTTFDHPAKYMIARLRRRTITREVSDFPLAGAE